MHQMWSFGDVMDAIVFQKFQFAVNGRAVPYKLVDIKSGFSENLVEQGYKDVKVLLKFDFNEEDEAFWGFRPVIIELQILELRYQSIKKREGHQWYSSFRIADEVFHWLRQQTISVCSNFLFPFGILRFLVPPRIQYYQTQSKWKLR